MSKIEDAYITSIGSYLPGPAISNDQMEEILGFVNDKPSRLRSRILKSNGIQKRHYALDRQQRTTQTNDQLAATAARNCLNHLAFDFSKIDMLAVATTQGDLPLPGMASMVQFQLGLPPCEILTTHGVCSSGVMALKSVVNQVRLGEKKHGLVCASEFSSRLLKKSRYEAADQSTVDLESEFLRWMLSDGSGAVLIQPRPHLKGISLKIEWIEIISYAADYDLCMSCGTADQSLWSEVIPNTMPHNNRSSNLTTRSWQDYTTYAEAERAGALLIRQNLRIIDNIVKVGVQGLLQLIQDGKLSVNEIDHFVCHYSSHYFRGIILKLLKMSGCMIPEEKWFTNLYSKGNTGCAAIYIALEELFWSGRLRPGEVVFCVVPESGRFATAYIKMTVAG